MKRTSPQTSLRSIFAVGASAALITSAPAASVIVDWGGNYVSANQEFQNEIGENDGYGGFVAGDPTLISPATGYSGTSATVYGQVGRVDGIADINKTSQISNNGTNDVFFFKGHDTAPTAMVALWRQPDFLSYSTGMVTLDETSSVRLNIDRYVQQNVTDSGRFVIRLGGDYYISEQVFDGAADHVITDLVSLAYYSYDPATSLNFDDGAAAVSLVADGAITGITEVGFYFETAPAANRVDILDFEVVASMIPEPSSLALLSLGALGFAGRRRRA